MPRSSAVDGFRLVYDREGSGCPVVLLHGSPGDRGDFREVLPLLRDVADVVVPDLRGFGESAKHREPPASAYSADAQARSVLGLIEELDLRTPVIAGYDVGSRIAQALARTAPTTARALVISPPVPGVGERVLTADAQREYWYQAFHQLALPDEIIDGDREAVAAYLRHFWTHWSGPDFELPEADLARLVDRYAAPGSFSASIAWYRAGSGTVARSLAEVPPAPHDRIAVPTTVLWPEQDRLFPPSWADRIDEFFSAATVRPLPGVGHFLPLEAPRELASAIRSALGIR
jgi:pimeloyl-ACP methyl ester carboxylesterase